MHLELVCIFINKWHNNLSLGKYSEMFTVWHRLFGLSFKSTLKILILFKNLDPFQSTPFAVPLLFSVLLSLTLNHTVLNLPPTDSSLPFIPDFHHGFFCYKVSLSYLTRVFTCCFWHRQSPCFWPQIIQTACILNKNNKPRQ